MDELKKEFMKKYGQELDPYVTDPFELWKWIEDNFVAKDKGIDPTKPMMVIYNPKKFMEEFQKKYWEVNL